MKKFLVVDFEFSTYERPVGRPRGFFSEIIEIGAVKLDGEPLTDCGRIQSFVKPHFYPKQAKDSMDFCMITAKDMQQAIEFPAMVQELAKLYESGETYFVAWGTEDYKVLQTGCERHKIENPVKYEDYLDLALAYRLYVRQRRHRCPGEQAGGVLPHSGGAGGQHRRPVAHRL